MLHELTLELYSGARTQHFGTLTIKIYCEVKLSWFKSLFQFLLAEGHWICYLPFTSFHFIRVFKIIVSVLDLIKKVQLVYLKGKVSNKKKRKGGRFRPWICRFIPKWMQWLVLSQAKARRLEIHVVFHVSAIAASSAAFPYTLPGSSIGGGAANTQTGTHMGCHQCFKPDMP